MNEQTLALIKKNIRNAMENGTFYAKRFAGINVEDIQTEEDFRKLPFTDKGDLREAYPLGLMAVPEEQVVRIHSSSGTTGTPVIIPYTAQDVTDWAIMFERCYRVAGLTPLDRVHRLSERRGTPGRNGHSHGPRQHRQAAAHDAGHGLHRAVRYLLLRAAAG